MCEEIATVQAMLDSDGVLTEKERTALSALVTRERATSDPRYYHLDGCLKWGHPANVRHLILQLQTLDPEMKVSSVNFIDTGEGTKARAYGLSMSYERWGADLYLDFKLPVPRCLAIWATERRDVVGIAPLPADRTQAVLEHACTSLAEAPMTEGIHQLIVDRVTPGTLIVRGDPEERLAERVARYEALLGALASNEVIDKLGATDFKEWTQAAAKDALEGIAPTCPDCDTLIHEGSCVDPERDNA